MKRLAGASLVVTGLITAALSLLPWIHLQFIRPRRYHYYYRTDEAPLRTIGIVAVGAMLIGLGWFLLSLNERQKDG